MDPSGLQSLLPAAVTIAVAVGTRRVATALFCGVAAGALAVAGFAPGPGAQALGRTLALAFEDRERVEIALFILLAGALLQVVGRSGGYGVLARVLGAFLDTARRARTATWGVGLALFFDDYANLLVNGATLRPLARRHHVSPALLAYVADQCATFVSLVLVSTWAAFEGSLLAGAAGAVGVEASATALLVDSLPFHAATWLGVVLALGVAWGGRWVGARLDREDHDAPAAGDDAVPAAAGLRHALVPLGLLVGLALGGLGVSALVTTLRAPAGTLSVVDLLGEAPTVHLLVGATTVALLAAIFLARRDRLLTGRELVRAVRDGLAHMVPAALVIVLSRGLAEVSAELGTGTWVTTWLSGLLFPGALPALLFVAALLVTVATGFSWSSMAILVPVAFQGAMAEGGPALFPVVSGAVISGAIVGGLMVPYSDTSVMAAAAFGITPARHARTQLPQALLVSGASVLVLLLVGQGLHWAAAYVVALPLLLGVHRLLLPRGAPEAAARAAS